jgi:hypothetical protein
MATGGLSGNLLLSNSRPVTIDGLSGHLLLSNSRPVTIDGLSGHLLTYNYAAAVIKGLSGNINFYDVPLYSPILSSISRAPLDLVNIVLDYCDEEFGVSPCTATGAKCYNTYSTCKDVAHYNKTSKTYVFSSLDAPYKGARPYVKAINWLPTEIKPGKLTVKGRTTLTFADEPDTDVGVDPYVDTRSSIQGTFWKKLLARNPNFKGRTLEIHKGFDAIPADDFELRWAGKIETIKLGRGTVRIEVVDELVALDKIEIPPKLDIELQSDVSSSATSITTSDSDDMPSSGYVKIDDELISYTGKNDTTNIISGCTRGALGTTAAAHDAGIKIDLCVYYSAENPFDIMEGMLTNSQDIEVDNPPGAGIASARVDSATFATVKATPGDEPNFSAVIFKPTKLSKLLFEIAELCDCSLWMNEAQKITIRRNNIPNLGGRSYSTITDEANIITASADLNEESRKSRVVVYWDLDVFGDDKKVEDFNAINIAVDAEAESENEYDGIEELKIYSRWIRKSWGAYEIEETITRFMSNLSSRLLINRRNAQSVITFDVELKDEGVLVGDYAKLSTDELQDITGADLSATTFSMWKRDPKDARLKFSAIKLPSHRDLIISPSAYDSDTWSTATDAQKEYGAICDDNETMPDDTTGFRIY